MKTISGVFVASPLHCTLSQSPVDGLATGVKVEALSSQGSLCSGLHNPQSRHRHTWLGTGWGR